MRKITLFALALLLALPTFGADKKPAKADPAKAEKDAVMKTVHQFVDGFNKGDMKSSLATCASPAAIIDEFPPYSWQGANACADWARDYDAAAKQEGMTGGHVTMGAPLFVDVMGDHGYAIFPVSFRYKQEGKPVNEGPAKMTLTLHKQGNDWKITAWTWSKR
jgi:ketosteroid isomerase-like protein